MAASEWVGAVVVVLAVASLTMASLAVIRERRGAVARLVANLAVPCGLIPLLALILIVGPYDGIGMAVLILCFQIVASAAENHIAGRLAWLKQRRDEHGPEAAGEALRSAAEPD